MKASVVTRVTIQASRQAVFRYLSDLQYHYLWNPHLKQLKPVKKLSEGMSYQADSLMFGIEIRAKNKVTRLVEPKELQIDNNTGVLHYCITYRLTGRGKQTLLTCDIEVVTAESKTFAFAKPVLQAFARRELQADLQALKIAVEGKLN